MAMISNEYSIDEIGSQAGTKIPWSTLMTVIYGTKELIIII